MLKKRRTLKALNSNFTSTKLTCRTVLNVGSLICSFYNWSYLNAEFEVIAWNEGKKGVPCSNALQCFRHWRLSADEGDHTWLKPVKNESWRSFLAIDVAKTLGVCGWPRSTKNVKLSGLSARGRSWKMAFIVAHRISDLSPGVAINLSVTTYFISETSVVSAGQSHHRNAPKSELTLICFFMMKQTFLPCLSLPPSSPSETTHAHVTSNACAVLAQLHVYNAASKAALRVQAALSPKRLHSNAAFGKIRCNGRSRVARSSLVKTGFSWKFGALSQVSCMDSWADVNLARYT